MKATQIGLIVQMTVTAIYLWLTFRDVRQRKKLSHLLHEKEMHLLEAQGTIERLKADEAMMLLAKHAFGPPKVMTQDQADDAVQKAGQYTYNDVPINELSAPELMMMVVINLHKEGVEMRDKLKQYKAGKFA